MIRDDDDDDDDVCRVYVYVCVRACVRACVCVCSDVSFIFTNITKTRYTFCVLQACVS